MEMTENEYYYPELDLEGTADTLFIQARNGYIEDPKALAKIQEILSSPAENKQDKAFYVGVLKEIEEDDHSEPYVFAQYKKDVLDECGSEEVNIRDDLVLGIMRDRGQVLVCLNEYPSEDFLNGRTGAVAVPEEAFLQYTKKGFTQLVNELYMYGMVEE